MSERWQLMPFEATPEMEARAKASDDFARCGPAEMYQVMRDAAPVPTEWLQKAFALMHRYVDEIYQAGVADGRTGTINRRPQSMNDAYQNYIDHMASLAPREPDYYGTTDPEEIHRLDGLFKFWSDEVYPYTTNAGVVGEIFPVKSPVRFQDGSFWHGREVMINGKRRIVRAVELFMHGPPWRKGESIGLFCELLKENDKP